jgi:hypothetical protein
MTPWETRLYQEARHNQGVWTLWHTEAFHRMEKLPDLKSLQVGISQEKSNEAQIKARFLARRKRENVSSS